ncbi:hypothetical protein ACH9L7_18665 (plasmid) [Haloferax sp. S1W]|uniref:hypothetical protein n=1 Tax=Haloferax sp. S1W TaxID=3377110 RepID=UPI0037C7300E
MEALAAESSETERVASDSAATVGVSAGDVDVDVEDDGDAGWSTLAAPAVGALIEADSTADGPRTVVGEVPAVVVVFPEWATRIRVVVDPWGEC